MKNHALIGALLLLLASTGCRGMESGNEPIHPNPNMDVQQRYNAQEESDFFADGKTMRAPVPGTVAKGFLREDVRLYTGRTEGGRFVSESPVPVTQALLERGQERYDIFCSVCHGQAGFGQGIVMAGNYGYTPAPTYHRATLRDTADGYLYDVIANGVRNMPGYAAQVPVADRWAIVAYIRALQRSQNARRENVPPSVLARIEQTGSANMNAARNPAGPAASGSSGATGSGTDSGSEASGSGASPDASGLDASGSDASGGEAPADTASAQAAPPPADTAGATTADAASSSSTPSASMDTASTATAVADNAAETAADTSGEAAAGGDTAADEGDAGEAGLFGGSFLVILLVVVPIVALTGILIIAFRKDRDH